jgi:ketosteroid isomerase-like protein
MSTGIEDEVRAASARFYDAISLMMNGDTSLLSEVWAHDDGASSMHPVGGVERGWTAVNAGWEAVARNMEGGCARIEEQAIQVLGDVALETGLERGWVQLCHRRLRLDWRVTNVYRREHGQWKVLHHHTDRRSAMLADAGQSVGPTPRRGITGIRSLFRRPVVTRAR